MIEGCRGDLDDAAFLHAPVFWNDVVDDLPGKTPERNFIAFSEVSSLFNQVFRAAVLVHPHESPPDLDVANVLVRESLVTRRIATALIQLEISRKGLEHGSDGNRKELLDHLTAVLGRQLIHRLECQFD